jgi:hypothetical protein
MCMAVYIAADRPLSLVAWDDTHPAFHVNALAQREEPVRVQFTKEHVFHAGAHEGCGCGFQLGEYPELQAPDEASARRASLSRFAAYLEQEIARVGPIELFACWEGDQQAPVEHRRCLTPDSLRRDDFFFLEKEFSVVQAP